MMAENKKKHNGQYRNPSGNDYGSTMKQFRAFDYNRLANSDQSGTNEAAYGASPFIIKHFGSPKAVPFVPKAKRGSEEHRVVEGETDEQKASRLQAKAEQLAQLAKDLVAKSKGAEKVKGFLSGKIAIKKAKELLSQKKTAKAERESRLPSGWSDEAARQSEQNALKAREEEEERLRMLAERRAKASAAAPAPSASASASSMRDFFNQKGASASASSAAPKPKTQVAKKPARNYNERPKEPPKGASWEKVKTYIANTRFVSNKRPLAVALYRKLNADKSNAEVAEDTGLSLATIAKYKKESEQ